MKSDMLFSIIIVHWNTLALTTRCVESIYEKNKSNFEIILVDNGSTDGSGFRLQEKFPRLVLIRHERSRGYAAANNDGIRKARGEFILLMNSDAFMKSQDPLPQIERTFLDYPDAGIIGGLLLFPDGKAQACGRSFLTFKQLVKQQLMFCATFAPTHIPDRPVITDYVDGAFLGTKRSVIDKIGLLNEEYDMYAEDMDWCLRAWRCGYQVMVQPLIEITHLRGGTSRFRFADVLYRNAISNCRFIRRFQSERHARLSYDIFLLGMLMRIPLSCWRRSPFIRDYFHAFWRCLRMRRNLNSVLRCSV
ncbi:glycosyltransferase family 2 protein [candidate division KSB1 bacterium]|nr:MAG: glycosyltransferase family 2 protein [candidate division KSB1 bacterium]